MIDLTASPRPARSSRPPRKLASGSSRSNPAKHAYRIDPQALQPRRENRPTTTTTAPGVSVYGMVGNDAVNRWDYLGLEEERSSYLEKQVFDKHPCYSLEVEGDIVIEQFGTTDESRAASDFGKEILGKRFKFVKGLLDAIEMGLTEGADLATSLEVTYQLTLLIEFECECKEGCDCSGGSGDEWEESRPFTAKDFDDWNEKSQTDRLAFGPGFGSHNPLPLSDEKKEEFHMMVSKEFHRRLHAAKNKCRESCR